MSSQTTPGSIVLRTEGRPESSVELGLRVPRGTSYSSWRTMMEHALRLYQGLPWKIGDAVFYGETHFGSKAVAEALEGTGIPLSDAQQFGVVAGRFPVHRRRRDLSFAHHAQLALFGSDAEQDEILNAASKKHMSVRELRAELKAREEERALSEADANGSGGATGEDSDGPPASVSERALVPPPPEFEPETETGRRAPTVLLIVKPEWNEAAHAQGMAVSDWLTALADEAVLREVA